MRLSDFGPVTWYLFVIMAKIAICTLLFDIYNLS
jgi:hypothetical protein